jgi:hypothetical protein
LGWSPRDWLTLSILIQKGHFSHGASSNYWFSAKCGGGCGDLKPSSTLTGIDLGKITQPMNPGLGCKASLLLFYREEMEFPRSGYPKADEGTGWPVGSLLPV